MKCLVRILLVFLLLILVLSLLFAIDASKVRTHYLNNGLKVIFYEMHSAPLIYSQLTYNVGSKYDPFEQTGISHVVEHMMFKGTKRFPKGTIAELISANGGVFNAYTSNDLTVYYELLPKNKIDLAFDIESERMFRCAFDPAEFESELSVIREERKQRTENSALGQRREELNTLLYKNHPYRNPVIGWMNDLDHITRDQAFTYYKKYYTPNNATLVLAGDFNSDKLLQKVKHYFGRVPRGPELEQPRFERVAQTGEKTLEFKHPDILERSISYYFEAPARFGEDGPALHVAANILGSRSATARLNKRLVRQERLCKNAGAGLSFRKDPATFNVYATLLKDADMAAVEAMIWAEIDSLANYPVIEYDLQKIKNQILFDELTGNQYISEIGGKLGLYDNYVGWEKINLWDDLVARVSKADIMRVVKQYLDPDRMVVCYSLPDTATRCASDSGGADVVEGSDEVITDRSDSSEVVDVELKHKPPRRSIWNWLFPARKDVREIYWPSLDDIIAPNPITPSVDSLVLNNGALVYFIENHDFPTFMIAGFIETGRLPENEQQPGLCKFTESMLTRGTKRRDYETIVEEKSFTPYQFAVGQSWNRISFQGYALIKDADKLLHLVYETFSEPSFPEEQLEILRPQLINAARNFKQTDAMRAFYAMFEQVFKGHPYALPQTGDPEVLAQLTREDLIAFYQKYYSPDRLKLIAVGDFDKVWLAEKLNATLGQWQHSSGDEDLPFPQIAPIQGKFVYVFNNPEYKQCRVDIGFNSVVGGIITSNPDMEAIRLLESILCGSSLTSRMGKKLRDEQGLSYGIKSNLWIRNYGGYWNIRSNLERENLSRMIRGIFYEIELVQREGVTEEELEKAKARKLALLPLATRTADDIGSIIYEQLQEHKPLDHFDRRREAIMAVTREDIQRVANTYFDTENYIIAVSGNISPNALDEFRE